MDQLLVWEAPEFVAREKSPTWIVMIWVAALGIGGLFLWLNGLGFTGILAAVVILLSALALSVQGRARPKTIKVTISKEGVAIGDRLYPWEDLRGFWIIYEVDNQALYLETNRRLLSVVSVQLGKVDPEAVRNALLAYLPEHADRAEEFSDRISRLIKF